MQLGHGELVRLPLDLKSLEVRFEERPLNLKGILNGINSESWNHDSFELKKWNRSDQFVLIQPDLKALECTLVYSPRRQLEHTAQQPE